MPERALEREPEGSSRSPTYDCRMDEAVCRAERPIEAPPAAQLCAQIDQEGCAEGARRRAGRDARLLVPEHTTDCRKQALEQALLRREDERIVQRFVHLRVALLPARRGAVAD